MSEVAIEVPIPFAAPLIDALQEIAERGGIRKLSSAPKDYYGAESAYDYGKNVALWETAEVARKALADEAVLALCDAIDTAPEVTEVAA